MRVLKKYNFTFSVQFGICQHAVKGHCTVQIVVENLTIETTTALLLIIVETRKLLEFCAQFHNTEVHIPKSKMFY